MRVLVRSGGKATTKLTDVLDERNYKGTISVALGPVALNFASSEVRGDRLDQESSNGGSRVQVHTDLVLPGAAAQPGKNVELVKATAAQIMTQFVTNLRAAGLSHASS